MLRVPLTKRCAAIGSVFSPLLLWAALSLAPSTAQAGFTFAADLEVDVPIDSEDISSGPGLAARIGYQLHLPLITITPEVGFHYASLDPAPNLYRGFVGGRLGIGEALRGGAFVHVGYGYAEIEVAAIDLSHEAFTLDGGAFLDLTILPLFDIGVHIGYGRLEADEGDPLQWLAFGVHAALVL